MTPQMSTETMRVPCYHCGDSLLRKQKNWQLLPCVGAPSTRICTQYLTDHVSDLQNIVLALPKWCSMFFN